MTDLRLAVDRLTVPVTLKLMQGTGLVTQVLPPLLTQLHDRISPTGGNDGGSKSASPSERSPADLNVLLQYAKISSAIRSWCHIRKVPVTRPPHVDPVVDLINWGASVEFDTTLEGSWYVRELGKWEALIDSLLHPGERFESDYPCPICKSTGWGDQIRGGSNRPILITYQKDDNDLMINQRAVCRGVDANGVDCNTVWVGHESIMELAEEQREGRTA